MEYQSDWDVYSLLVEDKPASIVVDMGLMQIAPLAEYAHLAMLDIHLTDTDEHGYPSEEALQQLYELDALIEECVVPLDFALYAGIYTHNESRVHCFYTQGQDMLEVLGPVMQSFPDLSFDMELREDPQWQTYHEHLYPDDLSMKTIQNRRMVEYITEEGDLIERPRPVFHWIYFATPADRGDYLMAIQDMGFEVDEQKESDKENYPYVLKIVREDPVFLDHINEVTISLAEIAMDFDAFYDGWETDFIKNQGEEGAS